MVSASINRDLFVFRLPPQVQFSEDVDPATPFGMNPLSCKAFCRNNCGAIFRKSISLFLGDVLRNQDEEGNITGA